MKMRELEYRNCRAICTLLWTLVLVFLALPAQAQELALGADLPGADMTLQNVDGGSVSIAGLKGEAGTVVVFWSNQCPWVDKYTGRVKTLVHDFGSRGVSFVLVNSNDSGAFPKESAAESAGAARGIGAGVTYLADTNSELAKAFGAERTPHVFVFNSAGKLAYAGTIDDSPGDPGNVSAEYLRSALDALTTGKNVAMPQTKAFGCTIKFKG